MINENLYKALTVKFGEEPHIVNPDVPAVIKYPPPRVSFLTSVTQIKAGDVIGGEQYTVNCPFCHDKRHRLYWSAMWNTKIDLGNQIYVTSDRLVRCSLV